MSQTESPPAIAFQGELTSRSFLALLATQLLGALNDNMSRWLVALIGMPILGQAEALSLGIVSFTLPYLLFVPFAGYLADRFEKRQVIVGCKVAEIGLMSAAVGALLMGNIYLLFAVVFLMGTQSALFAPSKFGSIPEILKAEHISTGNGWMALVTVVASALGTFAGYQLYGITNHPDLRETLLFSDLWPGAAALLGVAVVGFAVSLGIQRLPVADPHRTIPLNPFAETVRNVRHLMSYVPLLRTSLGIAFFWLLASLAQVNINTYGIDVLGLKEEDIGTLMVILVAGVGLGSVMAGIWSGGKVELGIVPLGALGIAGSSMLLFVAGSSVDLSVPTSQQHAYGWSSLWLFTLGFSAGLFNIPLEAYLQHKSPIKTRGVILAASNFISFSFILLSAGLFYAMTKLLSMSPGDIFLVAGLGTLPVAGYIISLLPGATIRFVVWLASHTVYRVRVFGPENVPEEGGALIVANHVSWLDGVLLLMVSSRPIRMVAYADYVDVFGLHTLARRVFGVIPIKGTAGPKAILRSLKTAREALLNGELVCIFAEGEITRTGQLQAFQRGMLRIIEGTDVPVIPTYLDGLWGSIFSYRGGKVFWKRPRQWPYPIWIHFGQPVKHLQDVYHVRQAIQIMGAEAMQRRKSRTLVPPRRFLRTCRRSMFHPKVADSGGQELTGGRLLTAALLFARLLRRRGICGRAPTGRPSGWSAPRVESRRAKRADHIAADEKMVGLLLPPSVGAVIANASLTLMRKVAVNLNYTLDNDTVNFCIERCGIRHVLTSRRFLEQRPFDLNAELVYLEDLKGELTTFDKAMAWCQAYLLPVFVLDHLYGLTRIQPDDLITVIFTSGSTGEPKGVMLSHNNVMSNVEGVDQVYRIDASDVLLGVLPFFHSFGYTGTLWLALALDPKAVYHFNPLDARRIGKLCAKHGVTIAMATPTFLRTYLKRCEAEQLKTLDLLIVGAEKLPLDVAQAFKQKFGVEPTEGYGTTELSPVVAVNVPEHRSGGIRRGTTKLGTVGRPLPGVAAKVVDPETGEELGANREGLLLIKGPNVMQGYLKQPDKTAAVLRDGWYDTGDFARIDDEGFITITGRQSRFSKIGGEMVPHLKVEEALAKIVDDLEAPGAGKGMARPSRSANDGPESDLPDVKVAVTSVPDERKGERLIVLHKPLSKPVDSILKKLAQTGLPNLWLPDAKNFYEVNEIPILGTGKLDLKGVQQLALQLANQRPPDS